MTVSIVKPTVGGDSGVWGDEINAALDALVAGINNLQGLLGSSYLTASAITSLLAGYASPAQITALTAQLGTKVDGGAVQTLTSPQQAQARSNMGLGDVATHAAADFSTPAIEAQRSAVNADHAAAYARIQRLFLGPASGLYLARSTNDYTFLVGLGSGRYAAYFLPRQAQSLNSVTYTVNCMNGMAVQIPMISQDDTAATFAGSGTWTNQPTTNTDGTTPGITGKVYTPKAIVVSTTASSGTITVTGGTPVVATDAGRRVSLPGAGAAGAELQTTIAAVNVGAQTFTVGTAPSATLTGLAATIFPTYRYNATSGGTAVWVSPANAVALALGVVTAANGGLGKVTVSGASAGAVTANLLPTAQQLVTSGRYPSTILVANGGTLAPTDRVLDCWAGQANSFFGVTQAIADGLTADTYTVTISVLGYQPTTGTGLGTRVYLDRFAYALAATTPVTAGASMFTAYDLSAGFASAFEYAIECHPASVGGVGYTFIGQTAHQYEDQQTFTVTLNDDTTTPPADGQILGCNSATITRTTKLYHPDLGAALGSPTIATAQVVYRLDRMGLTVTPSVTWTVDTYIRTAYVMMPLVASSGILCKMDRAAMEASAAIYPMTASGNRFGYTRSASGWMWDSTGKVGAMMYVPDHYGFTNGYATVQGSQVEDRNGAAPTTKLYWPWQGVNVEALYKAGTTKTYSVRYTVGYFSGGADSALAAA